MALLSLLWALLQTTCSVATLTPSSLVATIAGGSSRSRPVDSVILLDGSASFDPDVAGDFTFAWSCVVASNSSLPCAIPADQVALPICSLPANTLAENETYTFILQVWSAIGSRSSSASVDLTVTPAPTIPTPLVSIVNTLAVVNPSDFITLQGKVVSQSSTVAGSLQYRWTVVSADIAQSSFDCSLGSNLVGPANSINLLLAQSVLSPGAWTFRFTVTDPVNGASSSATTSFTINSPPTGGSCSLSPATGIALQDPFTLTCSGWTDPESQVPLTYTSYLVSATTGAEDLVSVGSALPSSSFLLPAGQPLTLKTYVADSLGAWPAVQQSVSVNPSAAQQADPLCFAQNRTNVLLDAALAQQDAPLALTLIGQLADLINSASVTSSSSSACNGEDLKNQLVTSLTKVANLTTTCDTKVLLAHSLQSLTRNARLSLSAGYQAQLRALLRNAVATMCPSTAVTLGTAASNLLTNCSALDPITSILHLLLALSLNGGVAGQSSVFNTTNFVASSSRTDFGPGVDLVLADGTKVTLSADAFAPLAALNQPLTAANLDSVSAGAPQVLLDTRTIVLGPEFALCRSSSNSIYTAVGGTTSIAIVLSTGEVANISSPLQFELVGDAKLATECEAGTVCGFWNPTKQEWSTEGCRTLGPIALGNGLRCECSHTGEFAILSPKASPLCDSASSSDFSSMYLVFLTLYLFIGTLALLQLTRTLLAAGCEKWLMATEHVLLICICAAQAINQGINSTEPDLSFRTQAIIRRVPYLFISWIFTFVIFAWASILTSKSKDENPFARLQSHFIALNCLICGSLFSILVAMGFSSADTVQQLDKAGVFIVFGLSLLLALSFLLFGGMLVRSLTQHFSCSASSLKQAVIAVSLSSIFVTSSAMLLYSVLDEAAYDAQFELYNSVYFGLDVAGLCIILLMFRKSVADAERAKALLGKERRGSSRATSIAPQSNNSAMDAPSSPTSHQHHSKHKRTTSRSMPVNHRPVPRVNLEQHMALFAAVAADLKHRSESGGGGVELTQIELHGPVAASPTRTAGGSLLRSSSPSATMSLQASRLQVQAPPRLPLSASSAGGFEGSSGSGAGGGGGGASATASSPDSNSYACSSPSFSHQLQLPPHAHMRSPSAQHWQGNQPHRPITPTIAEAAVAAPRTPRANPAGQQI